MSGSFVKIYGSILRSSVWQQPLATKVVWITVLALADSDGMVESSIPGLAATAGVSVEECEAALACFLAPDKYSGSPVDEGRRIRPARGGWFIINHAHYRELRTKKQIQDAQRIAGKRAHAGARDVVSASDMSATDATCRNVALDPDTEIRSISSSSAAPSPDQPSPLDAPKGQVHADVQQVFDHWREKCSHPRAKLVQGDLRDRTIRRALKRYSVDDLCRAVDGCALTDWNMGRDPRSNGKRFDDIELICRNETKIDGFIATAEGQHAGSMSSQPDLGSEAAWLR